jgi:hypothetical protein
MTASENQIIVYQPNETVRLDVRLENETEWLAQELIVIDAYPGVATLDMLAKRGRGVKIELADLRSQNVTSKVDVKEAA